MPLRPLGWLALVLATGALICAALPGPGLYLAAGLGGFAAACGWVGYSRTEDPGAARLAGAGAVTVGGLAVGLAAVRYVLVLAAMSKLETLL